MASLLLLSACDQQNESGRVSVDGSQTNVSFTPPTQLLTTRSIVRANLILEITIDGETSVVEPNTDGVYEFKTTRPVNSSTSVTVVWSELIDGELLPLARATKRLDVGSVSSAAVLQFSSTEFDTTSDDADGDGFSNYIERRDGEDGAFNDKNSPVSPPVLVTVDVQFALPVGMRDATAERRAEVTAKALVNSEDVLLSREGDVWTGSARVTENTEPLVTVTFYALADEKTTIASLARSQNVGGGRQVVFNEGDYDVDFNDDEDDFTNIQETAIGSNPRDSSDPRAPVADAGDDVSISSGATVTLNGSGSSSDSDGSIVKYRWIEGTNDLGTGVSLVVSGLGVGRHEITLRITDNLGLNDSDTVTVTVTTAPVPNQLPVANAGTDQMIESGASVTLNGGGSSDPDGSISTYQWSENGVSKGTGQSLVISNLTDGVHVVTLLVTDNNGATDTDAVKVTVTAAPIENQPPKADAGVDQAIASGASVTLDGSASSDEDGTIDSYQWSEGGVPKGAGKTLKISDLSDGQHVFMLLVTDNDEATDTATVKVTVTAAPIENQPPKADAGVDQTIASGASVTLDGSVSSDEDGTIDSYQWSEGGVPKGAGETLEVSDLSDGQHVFMLLVTDNDEATDTATVKVTVTAAPDPDLPPEAEAGDHQTIDIDDSVMLNGGDSIDRDGTIASYQWSEGFEILGTEVSLELSDLTEGQHVIELLVTDDDELTDSDTVTVTVTVPIAPDLPPMADAGGDQVINSGDPITLNGIGSFDPDGTIASYQWSDDLAILGTDVSLELSDLIEGEYEFTLLVTDDDDLTGTDTVSVTVTAAGETGDEDAPDTDRDNSVDGAKTSATGEFFAPIRTLA